jgi:hypothetical protein
MAQFVTFIGTFIGMGITYLTNTVLMQNTYGLTNNYDDLYKASFREPISKGMILLAIVGYVLSLIPFITMYTLTEEDHEGHIGVLKIRAALEDYATGALSAGQLEEAKQIYTGALYVPDSGDGSTAARCHRQREAADPAHDQGLADHQE